jgi:hypothetical protein
LLAIVAEPAHEVPPVMAAAVCADDDVEDPEPEFVGLDDPQAAAASAVNSAAARQTVRLHLGRR